MVDYYITILIKNLGIVNNQNGSIRMESWEFFLQLYRLIEEQHASIQLLFFSSFDNKKYVVIVLTMKQLTSSLIKQNISRWMISRGIPGNSMFTNGTVIIIIPLICSQVFRKCSIVASIYGTKVTHTAVHIKHWPRIRL